MFRARFQCFYSEMFCSLAQCVKGMLAFAIYITHGLACYVAIDITWTDYLVKRLGSSTRKVFWEYVVRTLLVLVTCKSLSVFTFLLITNAASDAFRIISFKTYSYSFLSHFSVLLAVAIPNLELFISLFGALCLSALGLAFPALIELFTHWKDTSGFRKVRMTIVNGVIILVGIAGLIIGTYTSLSEIIKTFFEEGDSH